MTKKQHARPQKAPAPKWFVTEDWLATGIGLVLILLLRVADFSVEWPLFEWFKK